MSNQNHPVNAMIRELRALRDNVAALATHEKDGLSYRAYLMQARSLLSIEEAAGSLHADASLKAMREDMTDDAYIERFWLGMVADWLTEHEQTFRDSSEGGSKDRMSFLLSESDKARVRVIHAQRHHTMIGDFCKRHAQVLRERCDELDAEMIAFQSLSGPSTTRKI